MQTTEHLKAIIQKEVNLNYLLHVPNSYQSVPNENFPLIVSLHGSAQRGDNPNLIKQSGLPKIIEYQPYFPFIVVSPQCPLSDTWTSHVDSLITLINDILDRYRIDVTRIYLTGFSLGGRGTWYLAAQAPELFAAVVPICGRGFIELAPHLKNVPVWSFHGENDTVVPLSESERMVAAVNAVGGNAILTVYPNTEHDSWTRTYSEANIYEWMLEHRK